MKRGGVTWWVLAGRRTAAVRAGGVALHPLGGLAGAVRAAAARVERLADARLHDLVPGLRTEPPTTTTSQAEEDRPKVR